MRGKNRNKCNSIIFLTVGLLLFIAALALGVLVLFNGYQVNVNANGVDLKPFEIVHFPFAVKTFLSVLTFVLAAFGFVCMVASFLYFVSFKKLKPKANSAS
ncbi:hypothetical protein BIX54_03400 [Mycoplasmoides pneumoniae]|nr:conserved hypothetical protein [Mycoplasmoides pneumoniae FH]ALA31859.1 hypothetical protein F536_03355 [Mycoplasmoides pneumoniae 39443]ALX06890.1 hypothetical protein AVK85_03310 [Mycoplasmoides pneumoniae]AMF84732.1 hypothetical protein AXA72_03420 [Mycoplasmoides pneumoniae]APL98926.1 hypothetical protein BIX66_03390 [Mycoplasmoides pneumoniae]